MIDSSSKNSNFWSRTFGPSFGLSTFFNKSNNHQLENISETDSNLNPKSFALNAYLTYVTLRLPLIMNGIF
jgi:hypothetical protein